MPKLKTHSSTKDKVRVTKNGKILARRAGGNHFLEKKSAGRKRGYSGMREITGKMKRSVRRKLGV